VGVLLTITSCSLVLFGLTMADINRKPDEEVFLESSMTNSDKFSRRIVTHNYLSLLLFVRRES